MRLVLSLALLLVASTAFAQPASVTVSAPVLDATGATFTITWSGGGTFPWSGGYSDGTAFQQGTSASPLMLRMPYHAAGAAAAWVCASTSCASFTVPAKPTAPPATTTHVISWTDPTTKVDGSAIKDLAQVCAYWKVDAGAEARTCFPAASATGGVNETQSLTVPFVSGTLIAAYASVDTAGRESVRTASVSKTIGGGVVPGAIPGTPTFTLKP